MSLFIVIDDKYDVFPKGDLNSKVSTHMNICRVFTGFSRDREGEREWYVYMCVYVCAIVSIHITINAQTVTLMLLFNYLSNQQAFIFSHFALVIRTKCTCFISECVLSKYTKQSDTGELCRMKIHGYFQNGITVWTISTC